MNANRSLGHRVLLVALAASSLASSTVVAEVGASRLSGAAGVPVLYQLDGGEGEDPGPINGYWKKLNQLPPPIPTVALNPEGADNGDGPPSLLVDPSSGLVAVAWARNSAAGFDVVVSRFVNDAWTPPQVVAGSTASELDPRLVLDPNGSIHMFYWVDGATPQVVHVTAPADLSSWSAPALVSDPNMASCRPAGAFYNGVLRVAYEVHNFGNGNTPRQVVLARSDNGVFTTEVVAMTNNTGSVFPQVHSQGSRIWVDWVDTEATDGSGEVAWTRQNAQGIWEEIRYAAFADRISRDYLARGTVKLQAIQ
jgi:hypothetical protein